MSNQNNQAEKLREAIRTGKFNREKLNKVANDISVTTSSQRTRELVTRWAVVGAASVALSIAIRKYFG